MGGGWVSRYACAACGREEMDDGWQPEGWIHTMDGRDLCEGCKR